MIKYFFPLKCSPKVYDFDPIEHLRDVVESEIRILDVQPTNLDELWNIKNLNLNFQRVLQEQIHISSRGTEAILKAKVCPIRCENNCFIISSLERGEYH